MTLMLSVRLSSRIHLELVVGHTARGDPTSLHLAPIRNEPPPASSSAVPQAVEGSSALEALRPAYWADIVRSPGTQGWPTEGDAGARGAPAGAEPGRHHFLDPERRESGLPSA